MALGRTGRRLASEDEVLDVVVGLADDGFASFRDVALRLRGYGEREIRRSVSRAVRNGLLLERRGSDGVLYVSLSSEGWRSRA
jgi:hypothetical protein